MAQEASTNSNVALEDPKDLAVNAMPDIDMHDMMQLSIIPS